MRQSSIWGLTCGHLEAGRPGLVLENKKNKIKKNPAGVIGIYLSHNPSDRTMALWSTQPLTEMSTRSISWAKGGRCVRLTTLSPSWAIVT